MATQDQLKQRAYDFGLFDAKRGRLFRQSIEAHPLLKPWIAEYDCGYNRQRSLTSRSTEFGKNQAGIKIITEIRDNSRRNSHRQGITHK